MNILSVILLAAGRSSRMNTGNGEHKLLLPFHSKHLGTTTHGKVLDGSTILAQTVENICAAATMGVNQVNRANQTNQAIIEIIEIIVVAGSKHEEVERITSEIAAKYRTQKAQDTTQDVARNTTQFSLRCILNTAFASGMASSICAGVQGINPLANGVMIALADMPFVKPETYSLLCHSFATNPQKIYVPTYTVQTIQHSNSVRGNPVLFPISYKQDLISLSGDIGAKSIIKQHATNVLEVATDDEGILIDIDTPEQYRSIQEKLQ